MTKSSTSWRDWAGVLCLLPLAVIAFNANAFIPQPSFLAWVGLELTILISSVLAVTFSLRALRRHSVMLKVVAIGTILIASLLGLLETFWLL